MAAVASDLLERAVSNGTITNEQFRIIYESERFPPAAMGLRTNWLQTWLKRCVKPSPSTKFRVRGPLANAFVHMPNARLVPVSYKDDWALIRRHR